MGLPLAVGVRKVTGGSMKFAWCDNGVVPTIGASLINESQLFVTLLYKCDKLLALLPVRPTVY